MANVDELNQKIEALDSTLQDLKMAIDSLKDVIDLLRTSSDGGLKFLNQEISSLRNSVDNVAKAVREKG
jgi:prefoldin subunit 5